MDADMGRRVNGLKEMTNRPEIAEGDNRSCVATDRLALNGSTEDFSATNSFVQQAMTIIMDEVVKKAGDARGKVCEWRSPEDLKELLDLELRDDGEAPAQTLQRCRDAISYSIKTSTTMAPVHSLIEDVVLGKVMDMIGWAEGGDGLFNAGGSMSNMYAMNLARFQSCPDIKELGLSAGPRLVLFTSKECHYSLAKAAAFLGIGTKNIYVVPADKRARVPFMVNATAGTTVLGSFDPIDELADACWGGAALVANSVAWNPHKMLMAGQQCSAFMVRDKTGLLQRCHSANAAYLFQTDKFYDISYDTGDKSIQCGRKADAFRFWLMWKALGTGGLERRVDRALEMAKYLTEEIKKREGFRLVVEVAPKVKERMLKKGSMMVSYQQHGGKANFFRMVVISPCLGTADMDFVLDEISCLGADL
ncbi:hypothetical protein CRUP_003358 [Coryphaenoides rupestris]|nr:hypothetical protein CRUP_003358 [Coryphaenoides rupestris]